MSPYAAMGNNPILYNDKEGGFIHIVIGGAIGGVGNMACQAFTGNIGSIGDGFAAFGIGAASTFLGAVGAGALSGAAWLGQLLPLLAMIINIVKFPFQYYSSFLLYGY